MEDKFVKLKDAIENIKTKKSKIFFVGLESTTPSASVYELYFHAKTMKDQGYDVRMLLPDSEYVVPDWIENELTDITHEQVEEGKISMSAEDIIVIPEMHSAAMEQTKNLPSMRIVLCQSIDYVINSLPPGVDWKTFNINDVIVTSTRMGDMLKSMFGKQLNVNEYKLGIPEYFQPTEKPKRLVFSIFGRTPADITKVVKMFYLKYPQYRFITFESMTTTTKPPRELSRPEFAKKLERNFAALWIDRISSYGTFPLECLKVGTIPVGIRPDMIPPYIINDDNSMRDNSGIWCDDLLLLPDLMYSAINKFLEDVIPDETYADMKAIADEHSVENAKNQIIGIYDKYLLDRLAVMEKALEEGQKKENKVKEEVE